MPYSHLSGAIVTSAQEAEHAQAMLEMPVAVRDGDDAIVIQEEEPKETPTEDTPSETEILDSVNINTDGEDDPEELPAEEEQQQTKQEEETELDFSKADLKSIDDVSAAMKTAEQGRDELIKSAVEKGLDSSVVDTLTAEYERDGKISEASYKALEDIGYGRSFIDSFIAGQELIATKFVHSIYDYAGGKENFEKLTAFIGQNHPNVADAFNDALERNDPVVIKAMLDSGKALYTKHFGKQPARNLANLAKPTATSRTKGEVVQPYTERAEMIKDMSDPRYAKDAKFRAKVEARVAKSSFF